MRCILKRRTLAMSREIGAEDAAPETAIQHLPQGEAGAKRGMPDRAMPPVPPPATSSGRNAGRRKGLGARAADSGHIERALPAQPTAVEAGGEGLSKPVQQDQGAIVLSATISALRDLQAQRRFCIKSISRCDRSIEAFIARTNGYSTDMDAKARKAAFARAAQFRREVEKDGGDQIADAADGRTRSAPVVHLILSSAASRYVWDQQRADVEREMEKLAKSLPVWPWVAAVRGLGAKGLAIIVGEAGDLANYATHSRLWKRLGMAVIDGERQQRKAGIEAAAAHGFNPSRRAEVWTIGDSLFRAQWRGAKEDVPAHAIGPYGERYARRKAATEDRGWSLGHRDSDARRVMTKALIRHLWKEWRKTA